MGQFRESRPRLQVARVRCHHATAEAGDAKRVCLAMANRVASGYWRIRSGASRMMPILALSLALSAEPFPFEKAEQELSEEIREEELKAHVYRLASEEFLGRRGAGAARAATHIAEMFEKLKLKPAFGESFVQPIPWLMADGRNKHDSFVGKNVGCIIPGSDPKLKDEWVLLSCHLDHLGKNGAKIYPGADDNASGCAMVLEV